MRDQDETIECLFDSRSVLLIGLGILASRSQFYGLTAVISGSFMASETGEVWMYTLIQRLSSARMAVEQVLSLGIAWLIAEIFYKFGSFTLELAAFLATWFAVDWFVQMASPRLIDRARPTGDN